MKNILLPFLYIFFSSSYKMLFFLPFCVYEWVTNTLKVGVRLLSHLDKLITNYFPSDMFPRPLISKDSFAIPVIDV